MKKIFRAFICVALFGLSAMADIGVSEKSFKSWIKSVPVFNGYKLDSDSFENYENKEFSAMYEKRCGSGVCTVTVKVQPKQDFPTASELSASIMGSGKEVRVDGRKAAYYVYKSMPLTSLSILIPKSDVVVSVKSAGNKMSLDDMQKIVKILNLEKL